MSTATTLPELTGSEKQVVWANDLRAALIADVDANIAQAEEYDEAKQAANLRSGLARLMNAPDAQAASFWIATRRYFRPSSIARYGRSPDEVQISVSAGTYHIPAE